jgi:hypothetical protein
MSKLMILAAGAAGYVLGAKAGRNRYDQIAEQARKLRSNPTVQQKVSEARHVAKDAATSAASTAADKVRRHDGGGSQTTSTTSSTPAPGTITNGFGRGDEGV